MAQQLKDFIELVLNKDNLPILFAMLITGILTFICTYHFFHKPEIEKIEGKIKTLEAKLDEKENRIREIQMVNLELNKQGSSIIVKDGEIKHNANEIDELKTNIKDLDSKNMSLELRYKELENLVEGKNKIINEKDQIILGLSGSQYDHVKVQINKLIKERHELLNPWMIRGKKMNPSESEKLEIKEEEDRKERNAKSLNDQIIELQKSISCKN